jgi:hypothetical protein
LVGLSERVAVKSYGDEHDRPEENLFGFHSTPLVLPLLTGDSSLHAQRVKDPLVAIA